MRFLIFAPLALFGALLVAHHPRPARAVMMFTSP